MTDLFSLQRRRMMLPLLLFVLLPAVASGFPQSRAAAKGEAGRVSNTAYSTRGTMLIVTYDLAGPGPSDVSVSFTDSRGVSYETTPQALGGDVGKGIEPGKGRKITWKFLKDFPYGISPEGLKVAVTATAPEPAASAGGSTAKAEGKVNVSIKTSKGTIVAQLDGDKAPVTVANFLEYAGAGHYDGTIFHRVIDGFMIQGGGFDAEMNQKETGDPITNEAGNGLENDRGTLAMARTPVVDSATAQFFINLTDNGFLNHRDETAAGFGYAVFGQVTEGMDVVDAIGKVKTGSFRMFQDVPEEPVVIESVTVIE